MRSTFVVVGAVLAAAVALSACELDCDPDWETCPVPDAGTGGGAGGGGGGAGGGGGGTTGGYCSTCTDHNQCGGAQDFCIATSGPAICGVDCSGGKSCPAAAYCASITDSYGASLGFNCVPDTSCGGTGGGGGGTGGGGGGTGGGGGGTGGGGGGGAASCGPACYTTMPDCMPVAPCTYELDMTSGSVRTCYSNGVKSVVLTSGSTTTMRYTKNGAYCYDVE
ncbi:MAG: hypothetical protein ACYC8T_38810, partial [Myxococcaceae bacterium]